MWRHKGWTVLGTAVAVLCVAGAAVGHAAIASADLLKVRLGGDSQQTRIVIDLDRSASAKLVSDGAADRRVTVVLPGVTAAPGLQGAGHGLVQTWMVDQTAGGARLQMDLSADAKVKRRFLLPPADGVEHYRYVVDIAPASVSEVRLAKADAPKLRTKLLPVKAELSLKKVVVIDAGHGGHDPGAQGQQGHEKDINLEAAKALRARLEKSGRYKVIMTRETDTYVGLASRVRIAQRADADLFISLHADSGPEPYLRGASVYTLSDKASSRSAQFVSRDDWFMKASLTGDRGVSDILLDLTQRATRNRSAAFAETLVSNIEGRSPMLRRSHRDAGFMVLLAPDVPAVLLEMGFISNPEDEQLLRDPARRNILIGAVGDAIDDYFNQSTRLAAR
ncbi:N-acetylmuramoyl-L-alanine amidase [Phenylobacterium sp. J367]|nr:N-acetylmuramoyl-L-alanine amidase [Phenylobacterium sp. J367]MCR5880588.1 N-acetylmuramoyl-L-alanine amidase [Phenylobacterium sp. J367]